MEEFQINNIDEDIKLIDYKSNDLFLLNPIEITNEFGLKEDIIEFHIIDNQNNILESDYNYKDYIIQDNINNSSLFNSITLDSNQDLLKYGYNDGEFILNYNFYRNLFGSSFNNRFYIKDISFDRLELKISLPNEVFENLSRKYLDYIINRNNREYYSDFILNFGDNKVIIGTNVVLDNNPSNSDLFIKLYEPLSSNIQIKDTLWVNEIIANSSNFELSKTFENSNSNLFISERLKGPNFNIEINDYINTTTDYLNINDILNISSSLNNQLELLKNITINLDFNNLDEFIHFSSAQERLENFLYKIRKLENLNSDLLVITNITGSNLGFSLINIEKEKNNIISNFDKFEEFLYFESGSNCFPKSNSSKPYNNVSISSINALEWIGSLDYTNQYYGGIILDYYNYDINNRDYLWNNLPEYIRLDEQNDSLKLFISMLGQHFDYLWVYIKNITNKYNNDNRLDKGISKDMIAETLKSFGIKLYTNSRNNNNIYLSLLGINNDNTFLPDTGSYKIDNYITASNYTIPDDNINKEVYKRIYNNLPYLLKSKGTKNGLRALINCFGIPNTILSIKEFGANIKEENYVENVINKFNYSFNGNISGSILIPFSPSNQQYINTGFDDINPDTIEFRFKLNNIYPTQSLLESDNNNKIIRITHISNSYAEIDFGLIGNEGWVYSTPLQLPLYNNDWWNINLTRETGSLRSGESNLDQTYILNIGNKNNFGDVNIYSSSIYINGLTSSSYNNSWMDDDGTFPGGFNINNSFSGNIQEFRYWIGSIPLENFKDHIRNPRSISYMNEISSYDNLIFRLPLGSELDNNITQYITSSHLYNIESFIDNGISSSFATLYNTQSITFEPNYEKFYINSPNLGLNTESNKKIKIIDNYILPDNTLSYFNNVSKVDINQSNNSNNIEVSLSPQNIINSDIIEQLGNFNIDNYIGDVKDKYKNNYPDLEELKSFYFKKYLNKYNLSDIIKLISYFDNSLFKMIKDFIPISSNLSSGLIVKSTILERNKIKQFEPIIDQEYYESDIKTAFISGSNSLDTNYLTNNISSVYYIKGKIDIDNKDNKELYNGEFKNSEITVFENKKIYENNFSLNQDIPIIELDPLLNNIDNYKKSIKYLKGDSNINFLTSSLFFNKNIESIKSETQEYNYNIQRSILPKYLGSKTISKEYNKYNDGDVSYGKISNIDYNNIYFGYFEEITSQSSTLPGRSNVYLKYLIDENSNITELSNNENIFLVQNIFNNTEKVNIILNNNKNPSKQKKLDGINTVYIGGYKLEPILQNLINQVSTTNSIDFLYENDIQIINENSSSVTSSLNNNALSFSDPILTAYLANNIINTPFNIGNFRNNYKILFNIQRNTPIASEIRQKISGSIDIKITVQKPDNVITRFYKSIDGTGPFAEVNGTYNNVYLQNSDISDPLFGYTNVIRSILVPLGAVVTIQNASNIPFSGIIGLTQYNTPGLKNTTPYPNNIPLIYGSEGVDRVSISTTTDVTASYNLVSSRNDFGSTPTFINFQSLLNLNEPAEIILRYNITGEIIIPEGVINGEFFLKIPGTNIDGVIESNIRLVAQPNGRALLVKNLPIREANLLRQNTPYYYTNPPEFLYITEVNDHGFNSGSSPVGNWYFERKNSLDTGSFFNILVGSYWLSNIIYNIRNTSNNIIQFSPDISNLGYEPIENIFDLKRGDIVRLYNEDKKEFSINFENEVIDIIYPLSQPDINTYDDRLLIKLRNEIPNLSCLDYFESGSLSNKIQNFIFLSKKPDESNIIINKTKNSGTTSSGIIVPENINNNIKPKIGNIIKQLKNQNLIK